MQLSANRKEFNDIIIELLIIRNNNGRILAKDSVQFWCVITRSEVNSINDYCL